MFLCTVLKVFFLVFGTPQKGYIEDNGNVLNPEKNTYGPFINSQPKQPNTLLPSKKVLYFYGFQTLEHKIL